VPTYLHGKTQFSVRIGGDYNILPGVLAIRAGVSYETDGTDPEYLNITNYQLGRTGLHVGATLRLAKKTDLSFAFAHFIQKDVALTVNPARPFNTTDPARDHVVTGKGDGVAKFAIADAVDSVEGPLFANAGKFWYHLNVVSVSLAQHF
jgi:long-subunit fatty acid transport protein